MRREADGPGNGVKRVLIVEDDDHLREALQELLSASGYETITAGDGLEALDWLARVPVHLIVADLLMPRLPGHRLIKRVRETREWGAIPILLLSAFADLARYRRLPVDAVHLKPFRVSEFMARVQQMIGPAAA